MSRATTHKWDEKSHFALLLALLEIAKPSKDVLTQAAEHMKIQGFQTTYHGVNQHIQKLRRTQDSPEKSAKNGAVASTPTKSTPKRKARTPKGTPAKSAAAAESYEDDEINFKLESYEEDEHDSKRLKNEAE
ncbi:hypothetical protein ED733_005513 [Metarhizium rileyi]|uniref:Uncharacterized protein n=1 Tax=Metarhizium rileyi (strain RCEF 4871) TaxID=1649241 RepID=A0A5C6GLZ0_METRR|nr:hypothetical protein ED733_005513 [Metarhizium rileyi]